MNFKVKSNQSIGNAVVNDMRSHGYSLEKEDDDVCIGLPDGDSTDGDAALISALNSLSNSIKELAIATVSQKQPIVVNLIASNDDDLKKFATIFAQGIK